MPLPSISVPTYSLEIPSTNKKIKYRPFLVREEKLLIIAKESQDPEQVNQAIKDVLQNCILTKGVDVEKLTSFDIEYLFLNVRGKSVGEEVEVLITCLDDMKTQVPVAINLDDIKVVQNEKHTRDIELDETFKLRMKYPSLEQFVKQNYDVGPKQSDQLQSTFAMIADCIEQVYNDEESFSAADEDPKHIREWIEMLSPQHLEKVNDFFETMPKLSHTVEIINPNTGVRNDIVLEGLNSFLA